MQMKRNQWLSGRWKNYIKNLKLFHLKMVSGDVYRSTANDKFHNPLICRLRSRLINLWFHFIKHQKISTLVSQTPG